jgi:hypothetical protein
MTSPTALAAGHAAAPAFNADFYMTAATVIPVLFLAIAVQGSTYTDILRIAHDAGDRTGPYAPTSGSRRETIAAAFTYVAAARLGVFVLVYGSSARSSHSSRWPSATPSSARASYSAQHWY